MPTLSVITAGTAVAEPDAGTGTARWAGVIAMENVLTGDGRLIEPDALRWENLPLPFRWVRSDVGAHDGAVVVGHIDNIWRDGERIRAEGDFDLDSEDGREAHRQVARKLTRGISVDLDDLDFEVRVAQELMEAMDPEVEPTPSEPDEAGRVVVMEVSTDDEVMVASSARIRGATLLAIPAFAEAVIDLAGVAAFGLMPDGTTPCSCDEGAEDYDPDCDCSAEGEDDVDTGAAASAARTGQTQARQRGQDGRREEADHRRQAGGTQHLHQEDRCDQDQGQGAGRGPAPSAEALIAAAAPIRPPAAWFADPGLDYPTPLTVTGDGRVYGHLACWDSCHTAYSGQCVAPPVSPSGYAYFRTGSVLTAEGTEIAVGHLTLDTVHAAKDCSPADTLAHYEHTGCAVADVIAGEDGHGIWVAGALRSGVTEEQVRALRASPLSGDWRRIGGNLELVAALAVNVPGFPIPRPQGLTASGQTVTLLASGMLSPNRLRPLVDRLDADDLDWLRRLAQRERAKALNNRLAAARLSHRVHRPARKNGT